MIATPLALIATRLEAQEFRFEGRFAQGGTVIGHALPGARVSLDGRKLRVAADGRFVCGFGRDHVDDAVFIIGGTTHRKPVAKRQFDVQSITGLPPAMVTPPPETLERIKRENALIGAARVRDTAATGWGAGWIWPVTGRISGVFGSQRVLNGQARRPHFGVDVAMPTGTPIVAPADGVVSLAERDFYLTGGTLMLDHGHGMSTIYAHLSSVDVALDRSVRKGEHIGRIGATGRVTGAHLHLGMNWFGVHVDPQLVLPPMPGG